MVSSWWWHELGKLWEHHGDISNQNGEVKLKRCVVYVTTHRASSFLGIQQAKKTRREIQHGTSKKMIAINWRENLTWKPCFFPGKYPEFIELNPRNQSNHSCSWPSTFFFRARNLKIKKFLSVVRGLFSWVGNLGIVLSRWSENRVYSI